MTSTIMGRINHVSQSYYKVSLFNGKIKKTFGKRDDAVEFARVHCINLLDTGEITNVAIHYERKDKRASYLIWEIVNVNDEPTLVEYEESAYDFARTHRNIYNKRTIRRMINEQYYSFHDFARIIVLPKWKASIMRIAINIMATIASIVFLFFGLHAIYMTHTGQNMSGGSKISMTTLVGMAVVFTPLISTLSTISYGYPLYKIHKAKNDFDVIDWRKLNTLRTRLKHGVFFIMILSLGPISWFIYNLVSAGFINNGGEHFGETLAFVILSFITIFLFLLIGFNAMLNSLLNIFNMKKIAYKYFTNDEIIELKKWLKGENVNVPYKTDVDYFVFPIEASREIAYQKIRNVEEIFASSTTEELNEQWVKQRSHYKQAIEIYFRSEEFKNAG